jgi:hypothetical protein
MSPARSVGVATAAVALLALPWPSFASSSQQAPPPAAKHHGDETPLMKEMEKLDAAMQLLKRSVREPAQDEKSLEQVAIAEQVCLAAKALVPKMAAHVADAERTKFVAKYRREMAQLLVHFAQLETALLDGDHDQAKKLWSKLDELEQQGHDSFTEGE